MKFSWSHAGRLTESRPFFFFLRPGQIAGPELQTHSKHVCSTDGRGYFIYNYCRHQLMWEYYGAKSDDKLLQGNLLN